jgi:hypothetical protein
MLSDDFIDWWFAPWLHADPDQPSAHGSDLLGQRDGYRDWCAKVGIASSLPAEFDPLWSTAIMTDLSLLQHTASLFIGLIAARQQNRALLDTLDFSDRKWCLSIAATQPLHAYAVEHPASDDSAEIRGLAEFAIRLEHGFPGAWPRLQLMLPPTERAAIAVRLQNSWADHQAVNRAAARSQRCWRLCQQRSEALP